MPATPLALATPRVARSRWTAAASATRPRSASPPTAAPPSRMPRAAVTTSPSLAKALLYAGSPAIRQPKKRGGQCPPRFAYVLRRHLRNDPPPRCPDVTPLADSIRFLHRKCAPACSSIATMAQVSGIFASPSASPAPMRSYARTTVFSYSRARFKRTPSPCPENLDYVKLPAMPKRDLYASLPPTEGYTGSHNSTIRFRTALALATVQGFDPHLVVVDHAPAGLFRELAPALDWLRQAASRHPWRC